MAETASARVPAWKRLGLKLKYAAEKPTADSTPVKTPSITTASTSQPPSNVSLRSNTQKRDREESSAPETPAKRVKSQSYDRPVAPRPIVAPEPYVPKRYGFAGISAAPTGKKTVFEDEDTATITATPISTEEPEEHATKKTRPSMLRKSVSFTPDTKQKDGETGQNYFKAWASGTDPTAIDPTTEEPTSPSKSPTEEISKSVKDSKPKKAKKPKKSKSTSIESKPLKSVAAGDLADSETAGEEPAYVAYLKQYHSDKNNWKFNKKKQNDLLKNIFNVQRLPAKQEPAILAYVAGLQGAARDRLAAQAEEVLKSIYEKEEEETSGDMSLSSSEARKAAYYGALMRSVQRCAERGAGRDEHSDVQLRELQEEVMAGKRAQALMEHALMMELHPEQVQVLSSTSTTATPPPERANRVEKSKRRKRKTRTTGSASSEGSSSSDDSSSDSDSDDDDVDEKPKKSAARKPIFGKELLDQAFPETKKEQQTTSAGSSDSDGSSNSDDSSGSESGA